MVVVIVDLCLRKIIQATVWRMHFRGASWRQGTDQGLLP